MSLKSSVLARNPVNSPEIKTPGQARPGDQDSTLAATQQILSILTELPESSAQVITILSVVSVTEKGASNGL